MNAPIGIFDSGLGGLSVAAEVMRKLPGERIVYFADNTHVPYGERPLEEIREFALDIAGFLIGQGAKAVVMACNMSSAVAVQEARLRYPGLPILGVIEPGAAAALRVCKGLPIGVLATSGTVKSRAYPIALDSLDCGVRVFQQACPKFVPLVESGMADTDEAEAAARQYVRPLVDQGCRTLILGCTHYPFLRGVIEAAAGPGVTIVDPAEETVHVLANKLAEENLLSQQLTEPHVFLASGPTEAFAALGSRFLGRPIGQVRPVRWGVDLGMVRTESAV